MFDIKSRESYLFYVHQQWAMMRESGLLLFQLTERPIQRANTVFISEMIVLGKGSQTFYSHFDIILGLCCQEKYELILKGKAS